MQNAQKLLFVREPRKLLLAAMAALPLSACWHVPMSALWRLRQLDTLTLDPAEIRLAVLAPKWIEAPPGHVHVVVVSHAGEADEQQLRLDLVQSRAPEDLQAIKSEALRGFARADAHFGVFRLAEADVARIAILQARARAEKSSGGGHAGKIQLTAEPCRRLGDPAAALPGPARVDLFLSTGAPRDFFQIYDNVDLRDPSLWPGKNFDEAIPACATPAP